MDKTDRLRDYGLAFLLYEQGLGLCGYELIRELFIFVKLILNSYLFQQTEPRFRAFGTVLLWRRKSCGHAFCCRQTSVVAQNYGRRNLGGTSIRKKQKRKIVKMKQTFILLSALCAAVLVGCGGKGDSAQNGENGNNGGKQWKTMVVKRSDTEVSQLFPASIQGRQDIEIRPQVQGKIVSVNVSEGQEVKRGQALFVIDPVPFRAALAQASAQVRAAMASSATARLNYESRKRLFDQKVVSKHDLLLAYNSWLDAQAQVSLARASEASARNNLSYTVVRSPGNGVVGVLPFRQGALVGPEITQPLTTVSDNSEMYVYFSMDENQLLGLLRKYGSMAKAVSLMDSVGLMLSDGGMYVRQGKVSSISGVINKSTGSVSLRADFANPGRLLHSGATGNVVMKNKYNGVIVIPQSATVTLQDKLIVYRVVSGKAVSTAVSVAPYNDGRTYIVLSGLKPGDEIVADGAGLVQEGMAINK